MAKSDPSIEALLRKRTGPGVLLFTGDRELVYANRQALALNRKLSMEAPRAESRRSDLAPAIDDLCGELARELAAKPDPKQWEEFQVLRVAEGGLTPILLRGIGMPSSSSFLILMEHLSQRHRMEIALPAKQHLTRRERAVVACVIEGLSNKEIAEKLGLSEHTVKDYLKRIMKRTATRTRTALMAKMIYMNREDEGSGATIRSAGG